MSTERETNVHESQQTLATGTQQQERNNVKLCNCREKASYPLNGKCLAKCVIYKATVTETATKNQESYIGLTDNEFKTRYNQHKSLFKLVHRKKDTKHIWELKDRNIEHTIQWEIIKKVRPYTPEKSVCKLCLEEKYQILTKAHSLNKRKEIFSHCVHRKRFLRSNGNTNHRPLPTSI